MTPFITPDNRLTFRATIEEIEALRLKKAIDYAISKGWTKQHTSATEFDGHGHMPMKRARSTSNGRNL